jgi:Cu/Zn superoxide dismutase
VRLTTRVALLAAAALAVSGCTTIEETGATLFPPGNSLEAVMVASNGSAATGSVIVGPTKSGIAMRVAVNGLPMKQYRVVIHTTGLCNSANAFSAGPPWVPAGAPPDYLAKLPIGFPIGDGVLTMVVRMPGVRLDGPDSIAGRSIVVHEGGEGPLDAQPGVPNNRVACGVIGPPTSLF